MQPWHKWGAALVLGATLGASHAQILVGQTAGFSGQVAAGVQETTQGAKLFLDAVNGKGGVHGQKIELISMDDKFDPKTAGENARTLIEDKNVHVMLLTRGTPHTESMIPHLDKHGVALVGPSTGAMVLHQPVRKHIFNVRATYQREAEKAMTHLASMGITRIAVLYADDSFGADGVTGAQKGLAQAKLPSPWAGEVQSRQAVLHPAGGQNLPGPGPGRPDGRLGHVGGGWLQRAAPRRAPRHRWSRCPTMPRAASSRAWAKMPAA